MLCALNPTKLNGFHVCSLATADFKLPSDDCVASRFTVLMKQPARGQRPFLLFPVTIFFFSSQPLDLARARSLSPATKSPDILLLKLSSGKPAGGGWHSKIIRSIK